MCSAPNVYMFVYILIGTHMVPLRYNLRPVASTYVCVYNMHEIAVSRKVRRVYEWSADIL